MRIYEGDCIIKQKFSLLVKVFTRSLTDPLSFATHAANGSRARSYIFNVYTAATLLSSSKVAEASGRTLFAGTPPTGTRGFFYLCRPILSQNLLQIEEDVYYQLYYQCQDINPFQILYPHVFMLNRKVNFLR